jgi:uncharacterized protein YbjT (DUF2867 family)
MRIAVVGASGATGRELVKQALDRGHSVVAVARDPTRLDVAPSPALEVAQADVLNPLSVSAALEGVDAVVSGLGIRKGDPAGTLTAGARALAAAHPPRMVWLGALGAGASAGKAGLVYGLIMRIGAGSELSDKRQADDVAIEAGATLVHPGPLTDGALSPTRKTVTLSAFKRPHPMPARVSRATVAAAMLDEAEQSDNAGGVVIPLP